MKRQRASLADEFRLRWHYALTAPWRPIDMEGYDRFTHVINWVILGVVLVGSLVLLVLAR
jgi:hypothetical protein